MDLINENKIGLTKGTPWKKMYRWNFGERL